MDAIRKVLVVDDDPVVGKSFDRVLSGKGYAVITAANGEEALGKLRNERYDMVFTDIKMPGMSGLEVAERVKAAQPWMPVVIVTGYGSEANEARAKAAGVSGFLHKPLSPEMIEGSAAQALREGAAAEVATPATVAPQTTPAPLAAAEPQSSSALKNAAMLVAAPFIGLAFVVLFPIVGLGMLLQTAGRALGVHRAHRKAATIFKDVALFLAAPFIGLAYLVAFPFIGIGMMAWMGIKALRKNTGN